MNYRCAHTGKIIYTQAKACEIAARLMLRNIPYDTIHSYVCEHCMGYHVGHIPAIKSETIPYNQAIVLAYNVALDCINDWLRV